MGGVVRRKVARLAGAWARSRPVRPRTVHPSTGLEYTRVRHVATTRDLRRAWARAARSCSRRNPELIVLAGGSYRVSLLGVDGLDLYGPGAVLLNVDDRDVLDVQGRSMTLVSLRLRHRGGGYAVHADCPGERAELVMVGVEAASAVKAGIGLGLFGGQAVYAYDCRFDGGWAGVHAHSAVDQAEPATFVFRRCQGDLRYSDIGSGQENRWLVDVEDSPRPTRLPRHVRP